MKVRSEKKDRFFVFLSGFFLLCAVVFILIGLAFKSVFAPGPLTQNKLIVLESGMGTRGIAQQLYKDQVISSEALFLLSAYISGNRKKLKAGEYEFPAHVALSRVLDKVALGDIYKRKITIPEGWTSFQVVEALNAAQGLVGQIDEVPSEGTILPDTYIFQRNQSRSDLLRRMQEAFNVKLDQLWAERQAHLPIQTKQQAVILASIIEKETGVKAERKRVAGVFINRLRMGMKLQSDPTVIYAITQGKAPLGRPLLLKDLETVASPYNTYMFEGLPTGAIANPGHESLEAALNPEANDEFYFVADGTGGHAFARTLEEHNMNVAKWRKIQAQKP